MSGCGTNPSLVEPGFHVKVEARRALTGCSCRRVVMGVTHPGPLGGE